MYALSAKILGIVAKSNERTVVFTDGQCWCAQFRVDLKPLLPAEPSRGEVDLMRSALDQLVTMGFLEPRGSDYRITMMGLIFANASNLLDDEG